MLTIGVVALWFLLSALIYAIFDNRWPHVMDARRSFSTFAVLASQGLSAALIWGVTHAIH